MIASCVYQTGFFSPIFFFIFFRLVSAFEGKILDNRNSQYRKVSLLAHTCPTNTQCIVEPDTLYRDMSCAVPELE